MTTEPTPQQWSRIFDPAAASPADRSNAEPDIAAMRRRLLEAAGACTDLAMDQAVLILENHRLRRLLAETERRPAVLAFQRREATSLLEYALHLRMHGENAPGGSETWAEFDRKAEDFLRTHGAAAALNATTVKEWADIAYEMWALLCDSIPSGHVTETGRKGDWVKQKDALRARFHAALDRLPDSSKIENGEKFGPHQADHGPGTWSPQPDADGNLTLEEAIGQALGSASKCWVGGTGHLEFDSFQAAKVHVGIMAFLADWADHIRKQANEATAAKMLEKERWT